jgi:hypothetical protein
MNTDRPSDISFDEALSRAKREYEAVDIANVRETGTYWLFPVRQIGCRGVVVDKQTGLTTCLGSAWDLDTWLWGYEKGLVVEDPVDLVVTEVTDPERAVEILRRLRISPPQGRRAALQQLPVVFERAVTWIALGELAADKESSFKWRIQRGSAESE